MFPEKCPKCGSAQVTMYKMARYAEAECLVCRYKVTGQDMNEVVEKFNKGE